MLEHLRIEERTMIFYGSAASRLQRASPCQEILGDRPACIAREVTNSMRSSARQTLALAESLAETPRARARSPSS